MTPSIDHTLHKFATLLPNLTLLPILTLLPNFRGFHRILQRVRLAGGGAFSSGHLVLCHLGLAFVPVLKPFFPGLVVSADLLSFERPSVLLFCFKQIYKSIIPKKNHERHYATSPEMQMTSVIKLHSKATSIAP